MEFELGRTYSGYKFLDVERRSRSLVQYRVQNTIAQRLENLQTLPAGATEDQEASERFLREVRIRARLSHPHVVSFFTALPLEGHMVMTTELFDSLPLSERLQLGPLPWPVALRIACQILDVLTCLHQQSLVHCDITPDNIQFGPEGFCKLSNFALARPLGVAHAPESGAVLGNPKYISPEQVKGGRELDQRSDLYSLSAVLYEMLCGRPPFESRSQFELMLAHVNQVPVRPSEVNVAVPKFLDTLVLKGLSKDPADRYATAQEFSAALEATLDAEAQIIVEPEAALASAQVVAAAEPGMEAAAEPVIEAVAEPVIEAVAEPVIEAVGEAVIEAVAEPAIEAVAEPVIDAAVEPMIEAVAEPVIEAVAEPVIEAAAEPVIEAVAEPVIDAVAEPGLEAVAEPGLEAVAEPVIEAVAEPVIEAVGEPVIEAVAEPVIEAVGEPVIEAVAEPVIEAVVEPVIEAGGEPVIEAVVEPVIAAVAEPVIEAAAEPVIEAVAAAEVAAPVEGLAIAAAVGSVAIAQTEDRPLAVAPRNGAASPSAPPDALHNTLWAAAAMVAASASSPAPAAFLPALEGTALLAKPQVVAPPIVAPPSIAPTAAPPSAPTPMPDSGAVPAFMASVSQAADSMQWAVFGGTAAFLGVIWMAIWLATGK